MTKEKRVEDWNEMPVREGMEGKLLLLRLSHKRGVKHRLIRWSGRLSADYPWVYTHWIEVVEPSACREVESKAELKSAGNISLSNGEDILNERVKLHDDHLDQINKALEKLAYINKELINKVIALEEKEERKIRHEH